MAKKIYHSWILGFFLLFPIFIFASPQSQSRRVQARLLIGDMNGAVREARKGIELYPDDPLVYEMALKSLAASGEDRELMRLWDQFHEAFPERAYKQQLLEDMCWGILNRGKKARSLSPQLISIIGAALTQDIRAVHFLREAMNHSNALIRSVAVQLAAMYGDQPLVEEIVRLFSTEKVLEVRLEVIRAIGKLKVHTLLPELIYIVGDSKRGSKEQLASIQAIVNMRESVGREELEMLVASKRSGMRQLASEVIAYCRLENSADLLMELVEDTHPEVKASALRTLGLLRISSFEGKSIVSYVRPLALHSLDAQVGVTAGWVWLLNEPDTAEEGFKRWLEHSDETVRTLAAAAIASAGSYGVELAQKTIEKKTDPYVQANLALGLIGQRESCDVACQILAACLKENHEKWMMADEGPFSVLKSSTLSHNPAIPNFPDVVDQTVRLELLNLLAILEYPGAQESIKAFLKQREWRVTQLAAETLLGEGDEAAVDLVRELLSDPDKKIRCEAALILAIWGRDASAIPILLEAYPKADRQLKIKIMEALGEIGDKKSIPFLVQCLKEPSLTLRMISASVLLQTLNH
ncbi:MAG: HEAT repeat domain-containing protein [Chlamydiales bacterium]